MSEFLARIKAVLEGKEKVVGGLKDIETATERLSRRKITTTYDATGLATGKKIEETMTGLGDGATKSAKKIGDFEMALRRVVIVAPVWMLFRAVIQGTMALIRDGAKYWEDFDRALAKSRAVIHGYSGTTGEALEIMKKTFTSFARESGISLDQLASSFYRFGTVGIAFQDALSGAIASAKLAAVTFSDVDTISRSLAMTYRLLGDTIDNTLSPMEKQESLAGKIYHLWKTNAFEANEFSASLNAFISTANIANFTADQTIALLASLGTAGVMGARGGTLLKTAIQKLVENLDELAPTLGLSVNPALEDTFSILMRVLEKINELSKGVGIPVEAINSLKNIFGGVRGTQVISALNALLPELKINIEDIAKDPAKFIRILQEGLQSLTKTVSKQLEIFRELRKELGMQFVMGLFGGEDAVKSLKNVNIIMEEMIAGANTFGEIIAGLNMPEGFKRGQEKVNRDTEAYKKKIKEALGGEMELGDMVKLLGEEQAKVNIATDAFHKLFIQILKDRINELAIQKTQTDATNKQTEAEKKVNAEIADRVERLRVLSAEIKTKLVLSKQELEILQLQSMGADDLVISYKKLDGIVENLVDRHNKLTLANGKQVDQITTESLKTLILSGNWDKILDTLDDLGLKDQEINEILKAQSDITKNIISLDDKKLSNANDFLKVLGLQESELIKYEIFQKSLRYGDDYLKNNQTDRLRLAQAITKEGMKQIETAKNLLVQYAKATPLERGKLFKFFQLMKLPVDELVKQFKIGTGSFDLILDNLDKFSQEKREKVMAELPKIFPELAGIDYEKMLLKLPKQMKEPPTIATTVIGAEIGHININLPELKWDNLAERAGRELVDRLKSDENFRKLWAEILRNEL